MIYWIENRPLPFQALFRTYDEAIDSCRWDLGEWIQAIPVD